MYRKSLQWCCGIIHANNNTNLCFPQREIDGMSSFLLKWSSRIIFYRLDRHKCSTSTRWPLDTTLTQWASVDLSTSMIIISYLKNCLEQCPSTIADDSSTGKSHYLGTNIGLFCGMSNIRPCTITPLTCLPRQLYWGLNCNRLCSILLKSLTWTV